MNYLQWIFFLLAFSLAGCLQTRTDVKDVEQRQVIQQQVVGLQKNTADVSGRFSEVLEQLREINGRLEVVENRTAQNNNSNEFANKKIQNDQQEQNQKINLLQEALGKLEQQLGQLNAEVQGLKAEKLAEHTEKTVKKALKDTYEAAEDHFDKKEWKKAILNFQKFRDDNPRSKTFAEATYKIGVSFQELGLKDEAKTFYDEVIAKFPSTEQARKAKTRLKSFKK
ncbi:MAG: tetratricopeptide repeat protein [Pseudobdellovibrionaceae bacterium]